MANVQWPNGMYQERLALLDRILSFDPGARPSVVYRINDSGPTDTGGGGLLRGPQRALERLGENVGAGLETVRGLARHAVRFQGLMGGRRIEARHSEEISVV